MDQLSLKGKTAVITGGARGLGLVFADMLAEAGAAIAILDIGAPKEGSLEALSAKHGVQFKYYKTNVTCRKDVNDVIETIEKEFGSIDINVNSAGVVTEQSFLETDDQNLSSTFNVNFIGAFLVAQACAKAMVRKWEKLGKPKPSDVPPNGSIIFIGSVATHISTYAQKITCYTATKAALGGLLRPMAMELAHYGITVNSLSPGSMRTDMFLEVEKAFPDLVKQFNQESMFGRVGNPEELKPAILYLAASRWTTGQNLLVDGGISSWKHRGNW